MHEDPCEYSAGLRRFAAAQNIAIEYSQDITPARGTSYGGHIALLPGQSPAEEFSTLELAHQLLHRGDRRISMGNPKNGVVFHSGAGEHLDFGRLGQRVVRPAVESLRLEWHGWHGFRRGIASNLYELGANDKIVQRILRHAKLHVTRERYIKAFDPAVLAAMKQMEAALDVVSKRLPPAYQVNSRIVVSY